MISRSRCLSGEQVMMKTIGITNRRRDDGYGDECRGFYFAGVAIFQDVEKKLVFPFCFEYSYDTDDSKHFSDEIVENDFVYSIVENYERSCRNVKEVLKRRE